MDIELECTCRNPDCKQSLSIRKGAVFYPDHKDGNEPKHWSQGFVNVYGIDKGDFAEVMLDPKNMIELRDWLIEMYPLDNNEIPIHSGKDDN